MSRRQIRTGSATEAAKVSASGVVATEAEDSADSASRTRTGVGFMGRLGNGLRAMVAPHADRHRVHGRCG